MEGAFFSFPPLAFFGFSGESFHMAVTYTHDVRTRTLRQQFRDTYSGHSILCAYSRVGFPPDRELYLHKKVIGTEDLLRLWFGICGWESVNKATGTTVYACEIVPFFVL